MAKTIVLMEQMPPYSLLQTVVLLIRAREEYPSAAGSARY